MINLFPYTDAHELNLDWCIEQIKANNTKVKDLTHTVENLHFDFDSKADKATTYTKTEVDTLLLGKANVSDLPDMSNYYDKGETDTLLASKADVSDLPDMTNYYTIGATNALLATKADRTSLAAVATSGLYSDLQGIPTFATVATTGDYEDLTIKPGKNNAVANAIYVNENQKLYYSKFGKMVNVCGRIEITTQKPAGQSNYLFSGLPIPASGIASVTSSDANDVIIINGSGYLTSNQTMAPGYYNLTCAYVES